MEGLVETMECGVREEELGYWVGLNRVKGMGRVWFHRLLDHFQGDLAQVWRVEARELARAGLAQRACEAVLEQRGKIEPGREVERLAAAGVSVLTWRSPDY